MYLAVPLHAAVRVEEADFERALADTTLPERPDYEAANRFLIKARRVTASPGADPSTKLHIIKT